MISLVKNSTLRALVLSTILATSATNAQHAGETPVFPPDDFTQPTENITKPVTFPKNTLFFTRKKEGDGLLVVFARRDSFVKLVDWDTKRLEAYFWVRQGTTYTHEFVPDSRYMLYFAQDVHESPQGEWLASWFGKTAEPIFIGNFRRTNVDLSISSQTHRLIKSDLSEFLRFNPSN
jgi:hypothetical protein